MSSSHPLSESELHELDDFLLSDQVSDDALDLIGLHGFLCAVCITPISIEMDQWLPIVLDEPAQWASPSQEAKITGLLKRLKDSITDDFSHDRQVLIPCELTLDKAQFDDLDDQDLDLTLWGQAFMEGVFLNESLWFDADEETVAGLLLPIMVASELFEEPEIADIRNDRALSEAMAEQVPEVLIDLFLHFRT